MTTTVAGATPAPSDFPLPAAEVGRLLDRLAREADAARLLDVAYCTVDSPVGALMLAATPVGLARIAFEREGFDAVLDVLAARISPRIVFAPRQLSSAARQLEEYFAGRRRDFALPLDDRLSAGFRREVQRRLPTIGYGCTMTYRQVAELVGRPAAVRAVGTACSTNPLPVVVPCHRVLRSDGSLGGYLGGPDAKTTLLALEHAA
jgi:methylated-DNA-[protein]-cysteine S-methyltransferase